MADSFPQIKHVIVLALENRSFDHMLGGLPGVNGASSQWSNSDGQNDYAQTPLGKWWDPAARIVNPDPQHETPDVLTQLQNANGGFVANYALRHPATTREQRQKVMSFYPDGSLAPLHTLAKTFAVCDRWHASVPGPTWTNRLFMLSGTARGRVVMPSPLVYDQPSIFLRLFEAGRSSRAYYGDVPLALLLSDQRVGDTSTGYDPSRSYYPLFLFKYLAHGKENDFPDFVFLEPAYTMGPNDDHPPHDPIRGQRLIAEVYNELRANDRLWRTSLLVILYDEHGGFADHVPPPGAVPPDGDNVDGFAFDRLGVRVPAVFVSPWLRPQVCGELFDHTSLLKSLTEKWQLGPLGARTAVAVDVFASLDKAPSLRTDPPHEPERRGHAACRVSARRDRSRARRERIGRAARRDTGADAQRARGEVSAGGSIDDRSAVGNLVRLRALRAEQEEQRPRLRLVRIVQAAHARRRAGARIRLAWRWGGAAGQHGQQCQDREGARHDGLS